MIDNIKISVVLPLYNPKIDQLMEPLNSIKNQTFPFFECLLVCDSTQQNVWDLISDFSSKDARFKVVEGSKSGLISALNKGIELATGEFIARMDADDVSLPERFSKQLEYIESNRLDIVGGNYFLINDSGEYLGARVVPRNHEEIAIVLSKTVPFAHSSVMIRRSTLTGLNLNYSYGQARVNEDYLLWTRLFLGGARFGNVPEWILKFRDSETSINKVVINESLSNAKLISKNFVAESKDYLNKLLLNKIFTNSTDEVQNTSFFLTLLLLSQCHNIKLFGLMFKFKSKAILLGLSSFIKFLLTK